MSLEHEPSTARQRCWVSAGIGKAIRVFRTWREGEGFEPAKACTLVVFKARPHLTTLFSYELFANESPGIMLDEEIRAVSSAASR